MIYRHLRIDYTDDCGANKGGYYCQIFRDEDEMQIDDFCIHPEELTDGLEPEDLMQRYVDDMYDAYRREGLLDPSDFPKMTM